jgi:hypothetical protein
MKRLLAILCAALSGPAFAQAPPCLPGGNCCINGTCGTLEQFKRNATIVCLQADAIENKSLPQSIELAGRCAAAQIAAQRVEDTQRANAVEHQKALDAQRKLREMGVPSPTTLDPVQKAGQVSAQAMAECRDKRMRGELPTHVASVQCSNPRMIAAFKEAHYRYMDLVEFFATKRLEFALKTDRGELTEEQAQFESNNIYTGIQATERQRDAGVR